MTREDEPDQPPPISSNSAFGAGKHLQYENHSIQRISERQVPDAEVRKVLEQPHWTGPAKRPGARKLVRWIDARRLTVIAEEMPDTVRIVSAYYRDEDDESSN